MAITGFGLIMRLPPVVSARRYAGSRSPAGHLPAFRMNYRA
jgi:hypothetical protein